MTSKAGLVDCPCGFEPQLRHDESRGLFLYACHNCKYHADPSPCERSAYSRWNRAAGDIRGCLGCGNRPRLRSSKLSGMWFYQCTGCGFKPSGSHTTDGAFVTWHRVNLPKDEHVWGLWRVRYQELQAEPETD